MPYNPGVQDTGYRSFASFGSKLGANLLNWKQQREQDEQIRQFRAALDAKSADPNMGTGEQYPANFGTGEQYPLSQLLAEGGVGAAAQPVPPSQSSPPAVSGANALYGGGNVNYGEILDQIAGKSGAGRSALLGKMKSL